MISKSEVAKVRTIRARYNAELQEASRAAAHWKEERNFERLTHALKVQADRGAMLRAVDAVAFTLGVSEAVRGNEDPATGTGPH